MGFQPYRFDHAGPMVISPGKSAHKCDDLKVLQGYGAVDYGIDMNPKGPGSGKFKGICGFMVAV
jgi:hypothetical protein